MTRSEEELHVGTAPQEWGRARLRKWVETESAQRTVPVQRERIDTHADPDELHG
jgi:stress response protein YsnF